MCRSMFSITTIASSTTRPVASVMPNRVSVLIENPNNFTNAYVPIYLQRVRGRQLQHAEADRVPRVEPRRRRVAFSAELDAADIADTHERAAVGSLQNNVFELRRIGESPFGADADLVGLPFRRRVGTDGACRNLH